MRKQTIKKINPITKDHSEYDPSSEFDDDRMGNEINQGHTLDDIATPKPPISPISFTYGKEIPPSVWKRDLFRLYQIVLIGDTLIIGFILIFAYFVLKKLWFGI
jgi:hypothetical protein